MIIFIFSEHYAEYVGFMRTAFNHLWQSRNQDLLKRFIWLNPSDPQDLLRLGAYERGLPYFYLSGGRSDFTHAILMRAMVRLEVMNDELPPNQG